MHRLPRPAQQRARQFPADYRARRRAVHDLPRDERLASAARMPAARGRVPLTVTNGEQLPYRSMADNACRSCHVAHSAPHRERLLYDRPSELCITCHDGIGGPSVLPVAQPALRATASAACSKTPRSPEQSASRSAHYVECTDCHNPHAVAHDILTRPASRHRNGPLVPPPMADVPGVSLLGRAGRAATLLLRGLFPLPRRPAGARAQPHHPAAGRRRQRPPRSSCRRPRRPIRWRSPAARPATCRACCREFRTRRFISCQDCHNNPDALQRRRHARSTARTARATTISWPRRYETADFTMESPAVLRPVLPVPRPQLDPRQRELRAAPAARRPRSRPVQRLPRPHGVSGSPTQHGHLINFDLAIVSGQRFYVDTGRFSGSCTLTCHGVQHVNFTYQP